LGEEDPADYDSRKYILLKRHIALWDVLESCERETSSDSNIKKPDANDFDWLFGKYTDLKNVFFNGSTAEKLFRGIVLKSLEYDGLQFTGLPSTSPANTMKFEEKLDKWKVILQPLCGC
jgi:TDG/mug DNA glycosylase family protein